MKIENVPAQAIKKVEPDSDFKHHLEWYLKQDFTIIPLIAGEKEPALDSWKPFQEKKPTKTQIEKWFYRGGKLNIGIVCGRTSGNLVVLDFEDSKIAYKIFGKGITKQTLCVKSGSGKGLHVFYRSEYGCRKFKISELALDVQGEGSYVAAPPSLHPSGKTYEIVRWTEVDAIKEDFEEWLYEKIKSCKTYKDFDPQKYRESIDAVKLLEGVPVGQRNQATMWLATWFRRAGKTQEETEEQLQMWNEKLEEPIDDRELQRTLQSAYTKAEPYRYWFKQNPEAYKEIEQFSKEEIEEAKTFLTWETEKKFLFVLRALDEVVKEEKTKVSLFLLELANESVHVAGDSAAGKSFLCDHVLGSPRIKGCFPSDYVWKITGTTDKSIRYLKDHVGTLYIAEFAALGKGKKQEESTAQFDVKLLISEGSLTMTVVEKNPDTKRWETSIYTNDSVKNVVTTSTDVDVVPELKNRMWVLAIDESPVQTEAVKNFKIEQKTLPPEKRRNREHEKKILRYAMKLLKEEAPTEAIIPYAKELGVILSNSRIRIRRDVDKLLKAVEIVAILNYKNRPILNGNVIAMPEDFWYAMQYMDEAVQGTFTEETKRFWRVWADLQKILNAGKLLDAEATMKILRCSKRTAYQWLDRLHQAGIVNKIEQPAKGRRPKIFYVKNTDKVKGQSITIEMKKLFEITRKWFTIHGVSEDIEDIEALSNTHILFRKKLVLPFSGFTTFTNIIKSLPDAPAEIQPEDADQYFETPE